MRACQLLHRKISNHIRRPIKEVNLIFPYLLETHDSKNVEIQDATLHTCTGYEELFDSSIKILTLGDVRTYIEFLFRFFTLKFSVMGLKYP